MSTSLEPIVGRYLRLTVNGKTQRIYFEEAGSGIPLLCLHTAGADGRQFRHLMNDSDVTTHFRVIAFDLPWHGKSIPPDGWQREEYRLTVDAYIAIIRAFSAALDLDSPAVIGCSIGGRIILHLAVRHAQEFRCLIGLDAAASSTPWYDTDWLHRPDVHGGEVCAGLVSGLMAPQSPEAARWETLWHYMQSGPGVFKGDLYFYKVDGDLLNQIGNIDTTACPLHLMTGDYDFSCTLEDTADTARQIAGANFVPMQELGHFSMSENPERFKNYLMPVLEQIRKDGRKREANKSGALDINSDH